MTLALVYGVTLLFAALASEIASRTVASTAVLFLVVGVVVGADSAGVLDIDQDSAIVRHVAELALFTILFTDGMRIDRHDLVTEWRLPTRALLIGLPLNLVGLGLVAHLLTPLSWAESLLVGAALSPTDPVFASAIVGREEMPFGLRHTLNVESGLNDGLSLPIVVIMIAVVGNDAIDPLRLAAEVAAGAAMGVALPAIVAALEARTSLGTARRYEPLQAVAIAVLLFALARITGANEFLAAFAGGITLRQVSPRICEAFRELGETSAEALKLLAVLIFASLISLSFVGDIDLGGYVFAVAALVLIRPLSLLPMLLGPHMSRREWAAAAWFGPKGFASVVYGLLILHSSLARGDEMFHLIAIVVVLSIIAHSSTDVVVARSFDRPSGRSAD